MSAALPNLFKGIAVVIDNGIDDEPEIQRIVQNIQESGAHAVTLKEIPAAEYDLEHFSRASFFIMDWNFLDLNTDPDAPRITTTGMLREAMVADNIAFLKRLKSARHAPVFIFSNDSPEEIKEALAADPELGHSENETHIMVMRKGEVVDKLYEVLEEWARSTPSVLTLKTWERNYLTAANGLFIDLHNRTPYWPVLMWQTFESDQISPEFEMGKLLNRLVESRMGLLDLDLKPFLSTVQEQQEKDHEQYLASMNKVLEGERFLRADRLEDAIYAPGDVFCFPVSGGEPGQVAYKINIRAECDCIRGRDSLELYLLKLTLIENPTAMVDGKFGSIVGERDNQAIIFAMFDGKTFAVHFKDLKITKVGKIRTDGERIGRLLPPFITRVQQRYASYVQRPGMPRIPQAMISSPEEVKEAAA